MRSLLADRWALALLAAALLIRLALAVEMAVHELDLTFVPWADMITIDEDVRRIAAGDVLLIDPGQHIQEAMRRDFYPPGVYDRLYPAASFLDAPLTTYLFAALYAIGGSRSSLVPFLNALVGTATCAFVYLIALRSEGRASARVALALSAIAGELVCYGGFLLREPIVAACIAWAVYETGRAEDAGGDAWMRAGFAWGIAWLSKTTVTLAAPFVMLSVARHALRSETDARARRRVFLRASVALALAAAAPVVPVAMRNVFLGAPPLLLSPKTSHVLAYANLPDYGGCGWHYPDDHVRAVVARANGSSLRSIVYALREHDSIGSVLAQLGRKIALFSCSVDVWDNVRYATLAELFAALGPCWVSWGVIAPPAAIGLAFVLASRARIAARLPLLGGIGHGVLVALIAGVFTRYKIVVEPFVAIFAAIALKELALAARDRRWVRAGAIAGAVVVCALVFERPRAWLGQLGRRPDAQDLVDMIRMYPEERVEARRYLVTRFAARHPELSARAR